ncbi:MAG: Maf family protein, partial [Candidatus Acidiferrales bacterium]
MTKRLILASGSPRRRELLRNAGFTFEVIPPEAIMARACRSASKRAMTCRVSIPGLMILRATFRRTGSVCSA